MSGADDDYVEMFGELDGFYFTGSRGSDTPSTLLRAGFCPTRLVLIYSFLRLPFLRY